jgi:hypothetical protein
VKRKKKITRRKKIQKIAPKPVVLPKMWRERRRKSLKCVIFIKGVPLDLKMQFKARCKETGMSMTAAFEILMRAVIFDNDVLVVRRFSKYK